ncbi:MAG: hypothetical protein ACON4O_10080 [Lentimonas sp.]
MVKKILLAVIAAAAVYFLGSAALSKGIKHGVETVGPKVTRTPVTLADVNISALSGKGTLKRLNVSNPEGYKSESIFALGQIEIEIDTRTVFSNKIIVDSIHIRQPKISYEKKLNSSNIKELLDNVEAFIGHSSDALAEETLATKSKAQKQVIIKKLIIEDGSIYVAALGIGHEIPLPRIEMNNLGKSGNTSFADVINVVLSRVLSSIDPAIKDAGRLLKGTGKEALKAIQESGLNSVDEATGNALDKASDGIKGLFGN